MGSCRRAESGLPSSRLLGAPSWSPAVGVRGVRTHGTHWFLSVGPADPPQRSGGGAAGMQAGASRWLSGGAGRFEWTVSDGVLSPQ